MTNSKQQLYSIKDLENFTQIKAHTIRIWEQRYQLLTPSRTESNIRLYNESVLKKILNIKLLYTHGLKISKIAALSEEKIIEEAKKIITKPGDDESDKWTSTALLLILDYDADKLVKLLKNELKKTPLEEVYLKNILPLMRTIGELWQVNTIGISHEHFFSNILKEILIASTHALPDTKKDAPKALIFLHDEEEHEFSVLLYQYLLKKDGYTCYYFGQKTPLSEVIEIQNQLQPEFIITTFTSYISQKDFNQIFNSLTELSKASQIIISGRQLNTLSFETTPSIHWVNSPDDLKNILLH